MAKLDSDWWYGFGGSFQTEEDVIQFIFENIDTSKWEDSYVDVVGYGEPNEMFKQTVEDKKELLYDFTMSLVNIMTKTKARIAELERLLQTANMRTDVLLEKVRESEERDNNYLYRQWKSKCKATELERDQAREEAAGHKQSLACALERNLKLAEECGGLEREVGRLREALEKLLACEWMVEPFVAQRNKWDEVIKMVEEVTKGGAEQDGTLP